MTKIARSNNETNGWSTGKTESTSRTWSQGLNAGHSIGHTSGMNGGTDNHGMSGGLSNGYSETTTSSTSTQYSHSETSGLAESFHKRPLVTPDEVGRWLGNREIPRALALISGYQPICLARFSYYKELYMGGFYDPHLSHPSILKKNAARLRYQEHVRKVMQDKEERVRRAEADKRDKLRRERLKKEESDRAHQQWLIDMDAKRRAYDNRWQNQVGLILANLPIPILILSLLVFLKPH